MNNSKFKNFLRLLKVKKWRVSKHAMGVMALTLTFCQTALAQAGADPFAAATQTFTKYQESVRDLMYIIAAIIAVVGAFNVYFKMQNGDQDVKKTIMLTLGGAVAFVALATALPAFFNNPI